jgi:hypothetical protein
MRKRNQTGNLMKNIFKVSIPLPSFSGNQEYKDEPNEKLFSRCFFQVLVLWFLYYITLLPREHFLLQHGYGPVTVRPSIIGYR